MRLGAGPNNTFCDTIKIRKSCLLSIVAVVVLALQFMMSGSVSALKCKDISKSYNGSIYNACKTMNNSSASGWWGAIWINDTSNKYDLTTTVNAVRASGNMTIYLHGLAICASNTSGCGMKRCDYIKVLNQTKGYPNGSNIGWAAYNKLKNWPALSGIPSSLNRPSFGKKQTLYSVAKAMTLNIDKMKQLHKPTTSNAQYRIYKIPLQVYRVGQNHTPANGGSSQRSDLNISIPNEYTLTAYAVTPSGADLNGGAAISSSTVEYGRVATVRNIAISNYVFKGWRTNKTSGNPTGGASYTVSSLTSNRTIYAVYDRAGDTFQGQSTAGSETIGYTGTDGTASTYYINNCSAVDGCEVRFIHRVKRISGDKKTSYVVSRTSNMPSDAPKGGHPVGQIRVGSSGDNNGEVVLDHTLRMYPGMKICESLAFAPNSNSTATATITVCASALGDAQPRDELLSGGAAFIDVKARNQNVEKYNTYQNEIYAKPGDKVGFLATYNPILQYAYYLQPEQIQIDSGGIESNANHKTFGERFRDFGLEWNNDFSLRSNFAPEDREHQFSADYEPGDLEEKSEETAIYTVNGAQVGNSLDEMIEINTSIVQTREGGINDNKTTPGQISFVRNGNNNLGKVSTIRTPKIAAVRVPYNFKNKISVSEGSDRMLSAGETEKIGFEIKVEPKRNNLTDAEYATIVRKAKWKLEVCESASNNCQETLPTEVVNEIGNKTIGNLNTTYNLNGATERKEILINMPDTGAGKEICIRGAVYPADSGADSNWQDSEGSHTWAYSEKVCFMLGKKPTLQVWGGNVFARGEINTLITNKAFNAAGEGIYAIEGAPQNYVYGSFGENGVIASAEVRGFSSGASTGYSLNRDGVLWPPLLGDGEMLGSGNNTLGVGGSRYASMCDRSPLTFANRPCTAGVVGVLGNSILANNIGKSMQNIGGRFMRDISPNVEKDVNLNDEQKIQNDGTYYYHGGNNDLVVQGAILAKTTIQFVHTKGDVVITGNVSYGDEYTGWQQVPKLVIYAKNIAINCTVDKIDAVLIADEKVVTCNNFENNYSNLKTKIREHINDEINSRHLRINGAVIAKTLFANRTYGSGPGYRSIVPAEIVNFDPTLYLWGNVTDDVGKKGDLVVTRLRELAPRR